METAVPCGRVKAKPVCTSVTMIIAIEIIFFMILSLLITRTGNFLFTFLSYFTVWFK